MSAYWGAPQSRNARYYEIKDAKKEDTTARDTARGELKDIIAMELEEDARQDGKAFNVCKCCGHMLFHANLQVALECGKLA